MISKIAGINFFSKQTSREGVKFNNHNDNVKYQTNALDIPNAYYVPFTASKKKDDSKLKDITFRMDTPAKNLVKGLQKSAKESGYKEITTMHVIQQQLFEISKYIDELNSGKRNFDSQTQPPLADYLANVTHDAFISSHELRKKVQPVIEKYALLTDEILRQESKNRKVNSENISFSEDLTDAIWSYLAETELKNVTPQVIIDGAITSQDDVTSDFEESLVLAIDEAIMTNDKSDNERTPFSEYERKAKNVLKNLSLGTNMYITYDSSKDIYDSFLDTVKQEVEKDGKYEFIELNPYCNGEFFEQIVNACANEKDSQFIIAVDPMMVFYNDSEAEAVAENKLMLSPELIKVLNFQPSNIKFLFYDPKTNYDTINVLLGQTISSFEEVSIPSLSSAQMIKYFKENPILMKDIKKPFSKNAIEKTIEASAQMEGVFPEKTKNLMKKIVSYYIDKREISDTDVIDYLKEATNLFKKNEDNSSIEVIFDTGKRLKDMVGKTSTQKEALSIVKQIKSGKLGTKGIIIYSEDATPGAGRKFTAKAIAGEARVPYIEMNTMDFGTKDVDLFGSGILSPEASMKKLFSIVTSQAEANPNKSAVLFIENFEYFSVGEYVSMYHQKAMAQLLREMEKAEKAGLNILVVGSVPDPSLIGEAAMKSFKFVDSIEVSSPAFNKGQRMEIIFSTLKKEKIKLAGNSQEQKETLEFAAQISSYFPNIQLKNLVKKAATVAGERNKKSVDKGDFTEAYLQITTGRVSVNKMEAHEKEIVASHECGHATNLQVMNNISKILGKPWHIPLKVDFITLDPRGSYGGAVFEGDDGNNEYSFEKMFSNIVCAFGGNSAESAFYNMDGSWGISSDMASVRNSVEQMVKTMGMGANTGKMVIKNYENLSEQMKQMIEEDERVIINNAKIVSDTITKYYADFNREFTKKYGPLVGTGYSMINGDDFRQALFAWRAKQSPKKRKELDELDKTILKVMEATKKGIQVKLAEKN